MPDAARVGQMLPTVGPDGPESPGQLPDASRVRLMNGSLRRSAPPVAAACRFALPLGKRGRPSRHIVPDTRTGRNGPKLPYDCVIRSKSVLPCSTLIGGWSNERTATSFLRVR